MTLAKRRTINLGEGHVISTPLLLPSFSSKGFPKVQKIFDSAEEYIADEILVSAYDVGKGHLRQSFNFATAVFLDSGGYESSRDADLSDTSEANYANRDWSPEDYRSVIASWVTTSPTVFVSFDGAKYRANYRDQVKRASELEIPPGKNGKDILIKPRTEASTRHDMPELLAACKHMDGFAIVGVTEKEIGNCVLNRMVNIAKLRRELDRLFDDRPIHVFGSLDTITTYMYFMAGADIFDGLTWLRYAFVDGDTVYRHAYGALNLPFSVNSDIVEARCWSNNYQHMQQMRINMQKFLSDGDFQHFGKHWAKLKDAYDSMAAELAGDRNGR